MKRIKLLRAVFLVLLVALCGRLYYVQVLSADELTAAAHSQQLIPVLQENSKGVIYDRNMVPLTGVNQNYYYLIHKENLNRSVLLLLQQMEAEPAGEKGEDYLVYRTSVYLPSANELLLKRHKAYGFAVDVHYEDGQLAMPLLSDLEQMYGYLLQKDKAAFYFLGNAAGGLTYGRGITESRADAGTKAASLITTLDANLQKQVEGALASCDAAGCVMVCDVRNGQILAMASRNSENTETADNLAVEKAYPLGTLYGFIGPMADSLDMDPTGAAKALKLGAPVFDGYPGEDAGRLDKKRTTATASQLCRILATLDNGGEAVPLSLVVSTVPEEGIPCLEIAGDVDEALEKLRKTLTAKPLTGDGWAVGYQDDYGIVVHLDCGNPEDIYRLLAACL